VSDLQDRIQRLVEGGIRPLEFEEIHRPEKRGWSYPKPPRVLVLAIGSAALLIAGLVLAVVLPDSAPHVPHQSTTAHTSIRLAGYTAYLPGKDLVSAVGAANFCQSVYPISDARLPMQSNSTYSIATPNATACIGSLLTASYGRGSSSFPTPDPVAPTNATPIRLGSYHAAIGHVSVIIGCYSNADGNNAHDGPPCGGTPSRLSTLGIWVQIPTTGGGYHDLIVGSYGLSRGELIALVESALPKHIASAAAGKPPWGVIPACAPGQPSSASSNSAKACA